MAIALGAAFAIVIGTASALAISIPCCKAVCVAMLATMSRS